MDLKRYLKGKNRALFASRVGTTKNYINLLACGSRRASPDLALRIEAESGGEVTLRELVSVPVKRKTGAAAGVIPSHITDAPT
jgi:transcriptional regulator with XRE-family HTH domain